MSRSNYLMNAKRPDSLSGRFPLSDCQAKKIYFQLSRSDTVRLNTSRSAVVSGSTQK